MPMPIRTLAELFEVVEHRDKPVCLLVKEAGRYREISTREFAARVREVAAALNQVGIRPGDRVALMAENGPHWPTVDFAVCALGAVLVPVYPTLLPEGAAYIVRDSGARWLFVQGEERLRGMLGVRASMPSVEGMVGIGAAAPDQGVEELAEFRRRGAGVDPQEFHAWCRRARPEDLATLIYTSGTTGEPKGVMLTHHNLVSNLLAGCEVLALKGDYVGLSFLPLSHSFERLVDYCYFHVGVTIAYAESVQTVAQNLLEVHPHVFVAVPRVFEKILSRIQENVRAQGRARRALFHWALAQGKANLGRRLKGEPVSFSCRIADRLVFSKLRERLGGRFVFAVSGGAPLARETAEFFWSAGLPIYEGYGLTETSPVISVNTAKAVKLGTVGRPIPGVEVQIAEDGEILARGPNVMKGYYNRPKDTAEVITSDGWFHTGDIGNLDADGFLSITDRKKELIINAYGKNIAPAPIENALKQSRWISQAVLIGDRKQYLVALLVPDFEVLRTWAKGKGLSLSDSELVRHAEFLDLVRADVEAVNQGLNRYEQVRNWKVLDREFSIEGGELTPKLSVKRRVIQQKYEKEIAELYKGVEN
jgi:long-chain acyl-CoA synthetase